ncbi:MAG: glutathione S-transferase family protein [Chloroflexota bacterium]
MITLYGRATAFNVLKVGWLLEELELTYKHVSVGGRFGGLDTPEFEKLNLHKKVPALVDGERSIWESHTILRYLAATYGKDNFYSADPFERSLQERWMDWSQSVFQPAFMNVFWGYYRQPAAKRDLRFIESHLEKCRFHLEALDKQLGNTRFLAGESLSTADIPAGSVLYRLTEIGLDVTLPKHVEQWYDHLKQRPGYQKWVMGDFTELFGRASF